MQYNPITKELYSDDGVFIKQLHCPYAKRWDGMANDVDTGSKLCSQCNKAVYDTSNLTDNQLRELTNIDPHACLKLDLNQNNLTITHNTNER